METDQILNVNNGNQYNTDDGGVKWQSCCFTSDKQFVQFFTQSVMIASVMIFTFYQLINKTDCSDQQAYLGILGIVLGVLLPNPKINRATEQIRD